MARSPRARRPLVSWQPLAFCPTRACSARSSSADLSSSFLSCSRDPWGHQHLGVRVGEGGEKPKHGVRRLQKLNWGLLCSLLVRLVRTSCRFCHELRRQFDHVQIERRYPGRHVHAVLSLGGSLRTFGPRSLRALPRRRCRPRLRPWRLPSSAQLPPRLRLPPPPQTRRSCSGSTR